MSEPTDVLIDTVEVARGFDGTIRNSAGIIIDELNGGSPVYYDPVTEEYVYFGQPLRTGFFPRFEYSWAGFIVKVWMDTLATDIMDIPDPYFQAGDLAKHQELWLHAEVIEPGGTHSYSHKLEETDVAWIDQVAVWTAEVGIDLRIGGDFERRASWHVASPSSQVASQLAAHYPDHHSPHGMPSPTVEYYYRPPDDGLTVDLVLTYDSVEVITHSDTYTYDDLGYANLTAYREAFLITDDYTYIGLPSFVLNIDCMMGGELSEAANYWAKEESSVVALSGSLIGAGSNDYEFDLMGSASSRWNCEDGDISFTTYGVLWWLYGGVAYDTFECSATLTGKAGGYRVTHSGTVKHLDGDEVAGAIIAVDDVVGFGDTTEADGVFSDFKNYEGLWSVAAYMADPYDFENTDPLYSGDSYNLTDSADDTLTSHGATLTNCIDLGEPYFPVENETSTEWLGFADNSMLHGEISEAYSWTDAITVSAPASKRVVDWLDSHTGWTITGGTADITTDTDGALKVSNIVGTPKLTASLSSDCWAGARLLEILYTSDDDEALVFKSAGSEWDITPSAYTVDVLNPKNRSGFGHTSAVIGGTWPWYWGVNSPGTVEISGLRAGETYSFKHIDLKRLASNAGGLIEVIIHPTGAFVGDEIKHGRQTDQHIINATPLTEQGGLIIVDGVVAGEIKSTTRTPIGSVSWSVVGVPLDECLTPTDGLVSIAINENTGWETADTGACWLSGGVYSAYNDVDVSARMYARTTVAPATWGNISIGYTKKLRGRARVQIVDSNKRTSPRAVTIKKYWGSTSGPLIDTPETLTTSAYGWVYTPALQQPICEAVTVGPGADSTHVTISGLDRDPEDYAGLNIYILGDYNTHQTTSIVSISGGIATLSSSLDEEPNTGSTGYIVLPVVYQIEAIDASSTVVGGLAEQRNHALQNIVILAAFAGATEVDHSEDDLTGVMVATYVSGGNIYSRASLDHGSSWVDARQLTTTNTAQSPCVLQLHDERGTWAIAWVDSGAVNIATSTDVFRSFTTEELMTGVTHPRIRVHPLTGVMLVAGWRDSDDSIVVSRSLDRGVTLSTAVVVVAAPEQAFGLDYAVDDRGTWVITYIDSDGDLQTVWSSTNGASWETAT